MEDVIRELQKEFDEAELHADAATLHRLIADDFLSSGPKGFVLDKAGWTGRQVHFEYLAVDTSEMDLRVYDKAAIVRDIQRNRATYLGEGMDLAMRVGQVWVEQGGDWRPASIQFSPLADS